MLSLGIIVMCRYTSSGRYCFAAAWSSAGAGEPRDDSRSKSSAVDGSNGAVEAAAAALHRRERRQLGIQCGVAFDDERVVVRAGDLRLRLLGGELAYPLITEVSMKSTSPPYSRTASISTFADVRGMTTVHPLPTRRQEYAMTVIFTPSDGPR